MHSILHLTSNEIMASLVHPVNQSPRYGVMLHLHIARPDENTKVTNHTKKK